MRALVVYESMFGNTHVVADHVADGLRWRHDCDVVAVADVDGDMVAAADLLVVGGPTHVHGMSGEMSRRSAVEMADKDDHLTLEPGADATGLREWFDRLPTPAQRASAAFDTRVAGPAIVTGRASKGISKRLQRHGYELIIEPESFLVDKQNHLLDGEAARAEEWGKELAAALVASTAR